MKYSHQHTHIHTQRCSETYVAPRPLQETNGRTGELTYALALGHIAHTPLPTASVVCGFLRFALVTFRLWLSNSGT